MRLIKLKNLKLHKNNFRLKWLFEFSILKNHHETMLNSSYKNRTVFNPKPGKITAKASYRIHTEKLKE